MLPIVCHFFSFVEVLPDFLNFNILLIIAIQPVRNQFVLWKLPDASKLTYIFLSECPNSSVTFVLEFKHSALVLELYSWLFHAVNYKYQESWDSSWSFPFTTSISRYTRNIWCISNENNKLHKYWHEKRNAKK